MKEDKTSSFVVIEGEGTDITELKSLQGRAKRKLITQKMMLNLIDVSKTKENPQREKAYWNTFHCQNRIISSGDRIYGRYCKNRFCTVCSAIRKADIINRYYPILKTWKEPHFLTLTVKAVKAKSLSKWINGMFRAFSLIMEKCKKSGNTWFMDGKGNIKVNAPKDIEMNAGDNININAGKNMSLTAGQNMDTTVGLNSMINVGQQYSLFAGNIHEEFAGDITTQSKNIQENTGERISNTENKTQFHSQQNFHNNSGEKSNLF